MGTLLATRLLLVARVSGPTPLPPGLYAQPPTWSFSYASLGRLSPSRHLPKKSMEPRVGLKYISPVLRAAAAQECASSRAERQSVETAKSVVAGGWAGWVR